MERQGEKGINDLMKLMLQSNPALAARYNMQRAKSLWPTVAGEYVAKSTTSVNVENGVMYVSVKSPLIRNEIMMMRQQLVARLNKEIGENYIKDLIAR